MLHSNEIKEIENRIEEDINQIVEDSLTKSIECYSMKECITGRNYVLAAATRLPRRTQELINRTLKELIMAKHHFIEQEAHSYVYVLQRKTKEDGIPAPVVFNKKNTRFANLRKFNKT